MKNILKSICIVIAMIFCSCRAEIEDKKFDQKLWNERDVKYMYRESMVKDLMENHLTKGMKFSELVRLIGTADNFQNNKPNEIIYEISVEYGNDIDPISGKNLIFNLLADSTINDFKLEKWQH